MLGATEQALIGVLILTLMVGMGTTLELQSFRALARRPGPILIGLAAQFGWSPLLAYLLARTLSLDPATAIGLVIVGSCPGGTTSNMFTYFARGDVALGVSISSVTTLLTFVTMPVLLWCYATPFTSDALQVPYGGVVGALAATLVPIGVGMLLRRHRPRWAHHVERCGSVAGALVIVVLTTAMVLRTRGEYPSVPAGEWLAAFLLGALGLALGHLTALATGLGPREQRTVAIEVSIQNTALALAIAASSFAAEPAHLMSRVIILYALLTTVTMSVATLSYRRTLAARPEPLTMADESAS